MQSAECSQQLWLIAYSHVGTKKTRGLQSSNFCFSRQRYTYMNSYEALNVEQCTVLVAVPVLNEELTISACLRSLLEQDCSMGVRVVVADGGSTDQTLKLIRELQKSYKNLFLVNNPGRIQSAGVNLIAKSAHPGDILVRADAHASYPSSFIQHCITAMGAVQATSVVVPMRTEGKSRFQRAVATAQNSLIGNGGAAHRRVAKAGFVEHGHHAAFQRQFFLSIGGYNENFRFNEDAEFDIRALNAGGKIWICPEATVTYYPRETVFALAKQYCNHGSGRAQTILLHRRRPKLRQLLPLIITLTILSSVTLGIFWTPLLLPLIAILSVYSFFGIWKAASAREISQVAAGMAAAVMHISWAFGFVCKVFSITRTKSYFQYPDVRFEHVRLFCSQRDVKSNF